MGLEHVKWSNGPDPEHDVTLPFTRMFIGPMDYTPGAMLNADQKTFKVNFKRPMSLGTRCHQLAMYAVYESPLQMLADSPTNYLAEAETMEFLRGFPTTWDETRVLDGRIGDYIVVARRRGMDWFVGAMTDWAPRELDVDLSFLTGGRWNMVAFADGPDADRVASSYQRIERRGRQGDQAQDQAGARRRLGGAPHRGRACARHSRRRRRARNQRSHDEAPGQRQRVRRRAAGLTAAAARSPVGRSTATVGRRGRVAAAGNAARSGAAPPTRQPPPRRQPRHRPNLRCQQRLRPRRQPRRRRPRPASATPASELTLPPAPPAMPAAPVVPAAPAAPVVPAHPQRLSCPRRPRCQRHLPGPRCQQHLPPPPLRRRPSFPPRRLRARRRRRPLWLRLRRPRHSPRPPLRLSLRLRLPRPPHRPLRSRHPKNHRRRPHRSLRPHRHRRRRHRAHPPPSGSSG